MAMETDVEIDVQIGDQIKCQLATSDGFFFFTCDVILCIISDLYPNCCRALKKKFHSSLSSATIDA